MQVVHIPDIGETSARVVVSVAALALGLLNDITAPLFTTKSRCHRASAGVVDAANDVVEKRLALAADGGRLPLTYRTGTHMSSPGSRAWPRADSLW